MTTNKPSTNEFTPKDNKRIITSKNSPELAARMEELSNYFLKVNDKLYKDLANK